MASDPETDSVDSKDEALCQLLGLPSLSLDLDVHDETEPHSPARSLEELLKLSDLEIGAMAQRHGLMEHYTSQSYCIFPPEFSIPPSIMRRLTDELTWGGDKVKADRSYEPIKVLKDGEIFERRTLTRFENFVNDHDDWNKLSRDYIRRLVSMTLQEPHVLFKEKLNLKPPGGSGFAPHLDGPSLRLALGAEGPQTFLTVMVAIDDMTRENGCLRLVNGDWSELNACQTISPDENGNPDAGGRAGAIPLTVADEMDFKDLIVEAGTIVMFNSWTPHRSSANRSHFPRRAVFLTYNLASEGDCHDQYYDEMTRRRNEWRRRAVTTETEDELNALATVPRF